jgi:Tol biopolymer transport system component
MKHAYFYLTFLTTLSLTANNIEFTITGAQQTKMPLAIMVLDDKNSELMSIAKTIQKDFLFTEQFKPSIKKYSSDLSKKEIAQEINKLAHNGTPLALCINAQSPTHIGWRLYDTFQKEMLCGKQYIKKGEVVRGWAHNIADAAWKKLTDHNGFFSSRLAYCKDIRTVDGAHSREIYMCDYDGSNSELVIDPHTVVVAPRWHNKKPLLYFSEYTDTNVRLVSCSLNKKQVSETISPFDEGIAIDRKSVV